MKQLAETVPLELSITGVETKQQGGEMARGSQLQAGMEWQQKRVFSWAGHLKGLSLDLQESPELLCFGLLVQLLGNKGDIKGPNTP